MSKHLFATLVIAALATLVFSQNQGQITGNAIADTVPVYKFSVGVTYLSFINFGAE